MEDVAPPTRDLDLAEPLQTLTAILPGSKWSCLLLRTVLQDALSEVTNICTPLTLRVLLDDFTAFMNERNKEFVEMAENVVEEVGERSGGRKKSKAITSCKYLEEMFQESSNQEGVSLATNVETLGAGSEGEGEKKEVRCQISDF